MINLNSTNRGPKAPIRHRDEYIDINTGKVYSKKDIEQHAYKVLHSRWVVIEGKKRNHIYQIHEIKIYGIQQQLF